MLTLGYPFVVRAARACAVCLSALGAGWPCLLGCPFAFGCLHNTRHDGLGLTSCLGTVLVLPVRSFRLDAAVAFVGVICSSISLVGPMRSIWADLGGVWLP